MRNERKIGEKEISGEQMKVKWITEINNVIENSHIKAPKKMKTKR